MVKSENKKEESCTNQIESFPVRVHGIMIEVRFSGVLNITIDTPIVAAEVRSVHLAMKVRICKNTKRSPSSITNLLNSIPIFRRGTL